MLKLTKHFCENWEKRVGGSPSLTEIMAILQQSIVASKAEILPIQHPLAYTLTVYWHADRKLIIKVDHFERTIVTVMSKKNMRY